MLASKINSRIYLGSYKYPIQEPEEFEKLKIDYIICCAAEAAIPNEIAEKYSLTRYPIEKNDNVSFMEYMDEAIGAIHQLQQQKKVIYLCCSNGNSRAPAVLVYYLMVHRQLEYSDAYERIQKARSDIGIEWEFMNVLQVIEQ